MKIMQNAMLKTKTEGGHIFRLVGLVGSIWHPKAAALFGRCQLFKPTHGLCQLPFFWSFSFSFILTFFPPYPCFRLTLLPLFPSHHAPVLYHRSCGCCLPIQASCATFSSRYLFFRDVGMLNKTAIVLPDKFCLFLFFFLQNFSRSNVVTLCDGACVDSGPKQNGG